MPPKKRGRKPKNDDLDELLEQQDFEHVQRKF
jgi:hypothetical protein